MKVKDVMSTELIVGEVPGTVENALGTLAKNNVSGMPILKEGTKKVVGVLTRSDIFKNPDEDQLALVMSKDFYSINKDEKVEKAAKILYENRIHGLPVLNRKKNLEGVISPTDILETFSKEKDEPIEKYYTHRAVPTYGETPINVVMEIINITHENALPILNDELKLSGIVTDGDLFKLSHIKEEIEHSNMGIGEDEDQWTWEGIRDTIRLYHAESKVSLPKVPVKEIMEEDVIRAFRKTPVCKAAEKMIRNNISNIPIVNSDGYLIGIITDIDLLACMF